MNILSFIKESNILTLHSLIRVVLAVALISLIFYYPGAIASPYDDPIFEGYYDNEIVEQASDVESVEHSEVTDETAVYQYSELSPVAKEIFDKTRSDESNSYTILICHDWTLTCDEYYASELPAEFQYGAVGNNVDESELYTVIEDEGEAYVLQTGALWHADPGWIMLSDQDHLILLSSLMVLLVSGVLLYKTIRPPKPDGNGFASWDIALACFIGIFALAVPYLHMRDIISVYWSYILILGFVAQGFVGAGYARARDRARD